MRCPNCSSEDLIRHGRRRTLQGPVQVYRCKWCRRTFGDRPIPYLNSRPILVVRGVSLYNQGYSLGQCSTMLEQAFNERVARNTIHYWTANYEDVFPYLRKRRKSEPKLPLVTRKFSSFIYSYHRRKVKDISNELFMLKDYIVRVSSRPGMERTGQVVDVRKPEGRPRAVRTSGPPESKIARMLSDSPANEIYRTVLINDAFTVCKNLPITRISRDGAVYFEMIPLVQTRGSKVRILVYQPERPNETELLDDLYSKSVSLSTMAGIPLDQFQVGWFDAVEMVHYEIS